MADRQRMGRLVIESLICNGDVSMKIYAFFGLGFRASFVLLREVQAPEPGCLRVTCKAVLNIYRDQFAALANYATDANMHIKL